MLNVIEIKPYLDFIRLDYEIEDSEFLDLHPHLKRMQDYLYDRRGDYFDKEAEKLIERMGKK